MYTTQVVGYSSNSTSNDHFEPFSKYQFLQVLCEVEVNKRREIS
jgi:hypothetical protein